MDLTWGNPGDILKLVEKIGRREGFGELLGEGTKRTAEHIGKGAETCAMHVKGLEIPAYEPRAIKGYGLIFATGFDEFGDPTYLDQIGERIICLERLFNVREGFSRKDDTLPARMLTEPLKNAGPATGQVIRKLDTLLDEYYDAFGYTRQGIPSIEKLSQIGLEWVVQDIERFVK